MNPMRKTGRSPWAVAGTIFALCALVMGVAGCDAGEREYDDEAAPIWQSLLFDDTQRITNTDMTTGHSQPAVSWKATDEKHVVAGLFSERIGVTDNQISNPDKIVWLWHSGLGKGHEGNVLWAHGNGNPKPLAKGTYFWGVWAFDDEGLPSWSTEEILHEVK